MSLRRPRFAVLLVLLLAAAPPLFVGLGRFPLFDPDEGRYAWAARVMAREGLSITPEFNHEPRFAKPAPLTWLQALSMRVLGETELALRLPSALSALGAVVLVALAGTAAGGAGAGAVAAVVLGTTFRFVAVGRQALVDAPLVLALTGALTALLDLVSADGAEARARALARAHAWMGLGALVKGPLALALPWIALLGYAAWVRSFAFLRGARVGRALLRFGLIALPYYLAMLARHGTSWLEEVLVRQHVKRALGSGFYQPTERGWDYFLRVVPGDLSPWTPAAAVALGLLVASWVGLERAERERLRLLLAWTVSVIAFFSVPAFKLPHYVVPAYPALALLVAIVLVRPGTSARLASLAAASCCFVGALGGGLAAAYLMAMGGPSRPLVAAVALASAATAVLALRSPRPVRALVAAGLVAALVETALAGSALPWLGERFRPERALADAAPPGAPLATYSHSSAAFTYYAGRRVEPLGSEEELVSFLAREGRAFVLTASPPRPELAARVVRQVAHGATLAPRLKDLWIPRAPGGLELVEVSR